MKPAIVILSAATGYGGGERSLETMLPLLAADHTVHILVQNARHLTACRRLSGCGDTLHVTKLPNWPALAQLVYGLIWLCRMWLRARPRFVLANNNKSAMVVALAGLVMPGLARRTILYVRDFEWKLRDFILCTLRRSLMLIPTRALLDPPGYLAPWARPNGAIACEVVMNAVDISSLAGPAKEAGAPYIVLPATVQEWKGHIYAVRALAQTPECLHALFLGDIQDVRYQRDVLAEAERLGVTDRIEFRGFDADIGSVLAGSVCIVVASIAHAGGPETFGRTVIEGWAVGRPVVAFATGGPRYLIEDGKNGFLVSPEDCEGLAKAVTGLLQNPALADRLGRAGHDMAKERFCPERVYEDFRRVTDVFLAADD